MTPEPALTGLAASSARAARGVLESFCPGQVEIGEVEVLGAKAEPLAGFPAPSVVTSVSYAGGATGGNVLVMTLTGAKRLAAAMMGMVRPEPGRGDDLDELERSAVGEAVHQVMSAVAAATGAALGSELAVSAPETAVLRAGEPGSHLCPAAPHATATGLSVLGEPARLVQLVPDAFAARMTAAPDDLGIEATVQGAAAGAGGPSLGGIPMRLTAELGRARMRAGRAVGLPAGSIVELDADVDAPVDLYVNGVRFATGRLLVTEDGQWAVRVEDVAPAGRLDHAGRAPA